MDKDTVDIKVSVVIPVYNVEDYVAATLKSILEQTLKEIQIIVVNDGSTDQSWKRVCEVVHDKKYAGVNITLIDQSNQGQSMARNAALAQAKGCYVYCMDSDDLLEPKTLETCYQKAEQEQLDVVLFNGCSFGVDPAMIASRPWFDYDLTLHLEEKKVYRGKDLLASLMDQKKYKASVCLHFIRRSVLKDHSLSFYPGILHEDELFTALLYLADKKMGVSKEVFFHRRLRPESIMTTRVSPRHIEGYMTVADELRAYGEKNPCDRQRIHEVLKYVLNPAVYSAWTLPCGYRVKLSYRLLRVYKREVSFRNLFVMLCKAWYSPAPKDNLVFYTQKNSL